MVLAGGIGVSDAMQYHGSNLAPTARYDELASLNARFAGRGPVLYADFDEYALYELRDLDVGGLDFMYPPAGLRLMGGHGYPVDLDRVPPAALVPYPLIVTRRDPTASDPPSAYRLSGRGPTTRCGHARPALRRRSPISACRPRGRARPTQCPAVRRLARIAAAHGAQLVAASRRRW